MGFPFVAVEGQEKLKKALLLNYINPKIGGLLIRGEKGTAKSTLVRALGELFPERKFINMPLHITEDNLLGSLDVEKTIRFGRKIFQEGLLQKVHGGILYIDEINLLGESILAILLEVLSRGRCYIEREGFSLSYDSEFVLIGSMNPEELELKASLIDKFGLYVEVEGSKDILERMNIIKKCLDYERNPEFFSKQYKEEERVLKQKIEQARNKLKEIQVQETIMNMAVRMVEEANTEGNRAEIILLETAKAIAAFDKRSYLNFEDMKEAATYVLVHRRRKERKTEELFKRSPEEQEKERTLEEVQAQEEQQGMEREQEFVPPKEKEESTFSIGDTFAVKELVHKKTLHLKKRRGSGKRLKTTTFLKQGRDIKSGFPKRKMEDFAFAATIRAAAPHQKRREKKFVKISIQKEDIRIKIREKRIGTHILFVVDSSGSMGAKKRMRAVKGAIFSLLQDAYEKRDKVALVAFRKKSAEELLSMTRSIELAKKQLQNLATGGKTPLAEGLFKAYQLIRQLKKKDGEIYPLLVLISDGRANISLHGRDPIEESLEMARKIKKEGISSVVIDTEEGFTLLEMAKNISEAMGAEYYRLENIQAEDMLKLLKKRM